MEHKPAVGFGLEGSVWDPNTAKHKEKGKKPSVLSIVWSLRKQFSVGAQIKHMTLPPNLCQPRSLLERYVDMYAYPCFLFDLNEVDSPLDRFVRILQFYVSSWHIGMSGPKKLSNPFNPVIGETLMCRWNHPDGSTSTYIAEQISHHPPISAAVGFNKKHQIVLEATVKPGYFSFLGNSVETNLGGKVRVRLLKRNETYEMTFPNVAVRGLFVGDLVMGYHGRVSIKCDQTGYHADLLFDTGKRSTSLTGEAFDDAGRSFLKIDGQWKGAINATDLRNGNSFVLFKSGLFPYVGTPELLDVNDPLNTLNVWKEIIEPMKRDDEKSALEAKLALEQRQRDAAAERERNGVTWKPRLFQMEPNSNPSDSFFTLTNLDDWVSEKTKLTKNDTLSLPISYSPTIRR